MKEKESTAILESGHPNIELALNTQSTLLQDVHGPKDDITCISIGVTAYIYTHRDRGKNWFVNEITGQCWIHEKLVGHVKLTEDLINGFLQRHEMVNKALIDLKNNLTIEVDKVIEYARKNY